MSELTQLFLFWSFSNIIVIPTVNKNLCNQPAQPLATLKHTHTKIFSYSYNESQLDALLFKFI